MFKARFEVFPTTFRILSSIQPVGNLNFTICMRSLPISFLRYGHLINILLVFDPYSSLKRQCRSCHLPRTYFFKAREFFVCDAFRLMCWPKINFWNYFWYNAIYDNNCSGNVKISLKHCWPLPEVGHITTNVKWFSVVCAHRSWLIRSF